MCVYDGGMRVELREDCVMYDVVVRGMCVERERERERERVVWNICQGEVRSGVGG